ncbi:MAG: hypothetical protein K6G64_09710 [Eubacterium sp.]|nr:hypothetical protein [Eubacterium sp.]
MKKKIFALFMALTLLGSTISISADEEGVVVDNPWADFFAGTKIGFDVNDSYLNGWTGSSATVESQNNNAIVKVATTGTSEGDESMWAIQIKSVTFDVIVGEKYKYTATLMSTKDKEIVIKLASTDGNNTEYKALRVQLKANESKNIAIDNIEPTMNGMQVIYGLGTMGTETPVTNFEIVLNNSLIEGTLPKNNPTTEVTTSEITSEATSEVGTSEVTTSEVSTSEVTTAEVTTAEVTTAEVTTEPVSGSSNETSTKEQKTTSSEQQQIQAFQKQCGVAKVKLALKAKRSAKKIKVTLKKNVKGADGLVVRFYKSRKLAKTNKKYVKEFTVVGNPKAFSLKNKKLKAKKLFIRVCGYKMIGGKKVFAKKWSVTKMVKIAKKKS